jgi:hypothetical protein
MQTQDKGYREQRTVKSPNWCTFRLARIARLTTIAMSVS